MPLTTPLTDLLGLEHPILLAPMAGASGGALAGAVSAAGGLGLLGVGYDGADWVEEQFRLAGNRRVGIGFITWRLAETPELLDGALAHEPAVVMLSFGDASPFINKIKDAGAKVVLQVQSVAAAQAAAELGADLIVAQGSEAGGHGALRATFTLVPAAVDAAAPVPVVAAGGIADGRGLAAALMLGAAGVLMGTRFVAAEEALTSEGARRRVVAASGDDTVRGNVLDLVRGLDWPAPYNIRTLRNSFIDRWHGNENAMKERLPAERARYEAARAAEDFDITPVIAGEAVDMVKDVAPAAVLVRRTVSEAEEALAAGRALIA